MMQAMQRRLHGQREEGFTLIELMVVVLIIAILIAIAIPTFLGARARAEDRAAQSNLRNSLTAEKVSFTDNQAYTQDTAALLLIEPSIGWAGDAPITTTTVPNQVFVSASPTTSVRLGAKSKSGTCFYIQDNSVASTGVVAGTFYGFNATCTAPSATTIALGTFAG